MNRPFIEWSRPNLRKFSIFIYLLLLYFYSFSSFAAELPLQVNRPPVILSQGEQRLLFLPEMVRYALGSPILRVLRAPGGHPDRLLMKAVKPGITDLWVWKKDGSAEHRPIEVRAWKQGPGSDLERKISELDEVEIWVTGNPAAGKPNYVAQGEVTREIEMRRIGQLIALFPETFFSEVRPSLPLYTSGEKALRNALSKLKESDDFELSAEIDSRTLSVRGGASDPKRREAITQILRRAYPLVALEIDSLPDRNPTVHFKVFLLELRKNRSRSIGLDLPGLIPNALRVSGIGIRTSLNLEAAINALENDGSARVLSRPELVVRAPGDAELFAGGEVPIETKTAYSSRVEWRSYGLTLKLKVQQASGRRVRTDILTEVSHLDPQISSSATPGLQSNRMKTQVDATFDQPLLLSGLLQEGVKKSVRGLPFLKNLPVLGLLFGSQDFIEDRSELVAILLPSRNIPAAPRIAIGIDHVEGPAPLPRNWMSPEEEIALRSSPDFPWNAFPREGNALGGNESAFDPNLQSPSLNHAPEDFSP